MKKLAPALFLAAAALCLLISPAMAADPQQAAPALSAADRAFIASLAAQVGTPVPTPAAKRPGRGLQKALCSASANCWDGSTVSCQSDTSPSNCSAVDSNCSAGQRGYVTCDGVTSWCPPCPCDLDCNAERAICQMECYPCPISFSCSLSTCTTFCRCRFQQCPV